MPKTVLFLIVLLGFCLTGRAAADDWARFRGMDASGVSKQPAPTEWSESKNIRWKIDLPGAGVSCPIIIGEKIFLTCYSGYGLDRRNPGEIDDLKRHVVCVDRSTGKTLWSKTIENETSEDRYSGMGVPEHGYASHTPVSDGKAVYAFLGKSGVYAYDLDGNELWKTSVGSGSDDRRWGSASSPVIYKDTLIVPAIAESGAIIGLNKKDGKSLWKQDAGGLKGSWSTPLVVKVDQERSDLVIGVPYEVWGLNPSNGKLRWFLPIEGRSFYTSVTTNAGVIYGAIGGRDGGCSFAVKVGAKDDASEEFKVWEGSDQSHYASPVIHDGLMFFVSNGVGHAIDAQTGERVKRLRLQDSPKQDSDEEESAGSRVRRGGRSLDYSSPVIAGDKIYYVKRNGAMFVLSADKDMKQIAVNRVTQEPEEFSATPAISNGQIFMRSNKRLYCIEESDK